MPLGYVSPGEQRFIDWVDNYTFDYNWNGCEYWMHAEIDEEEGTQRIIVIQGNGCSGKLKLGATMKASAFDSLRYVYEEDTPLECDAV